MSNDINSTLWLVLLTEVTELKVMVPTATVTVIYYIYTGRKENDYHKNRKALHMHRRMRYSSWETHNLDYSHALLHRTQGNIHRAESATLSSVNLITRSMSYDSVS